MRLLGRNCFQHVELPNVRGKAKHFAFDHPKFAIEQGSQSESNLEQVARLRALDGDRAREVVHLKLSNPGCGK